MVKKLFMTGLGLFASCATFADNLSGTVTVEDVRYNPSVEITKVIEIYSITGNTSQQCGGVSKAYGGTDLNYFARKAEIPQYQTLCVNGPANFIHIKWRANAGQWIVEDFNLPPAGIEPHCDIHIKLEDNINPAWPATYHMYYSEGCGRP